MKKTHTGKIKILKIQKVLISKIIFYKNQNKIYKITWHFNRMQKIMAAME